MKRNHRSIPDDEIDLREIILTLWKEKYLILVIALVFAVVGYIYGTQQLKVYQTTITLRTAPTSVFEKYRPYIYKSPQQQQQQQQQQPQQQQMGYDFFYNQDFKLNLLSLDNLVKFVQQNKKLAELKSFLKRKNIKTRDYLQNKLQPVKVNKNNRPNQYKLNFSNPLPGEEFLNDYVIFVKQITQDAFKKQMIETIKVEIQILKHNLEVSEKINLENPLLKSFTQSNTVVNEPDELFYKGSKVLSHKILYLNQLLNQTENLILNYNPILEQASNPISVTKSAITFMAIAFGFGLFISIILIFIRSIFLR